MEDPQPAADPHVQAQTAFKSRKVNPDEQIVSAIQGRLASESITKDQAQYSSVPMEPQISGNGENEWSDSNPRETHGASPDPKPPWIAKESSSFFQVES